MTTIPSAHMPAPHHIINSLQQREMRHILLLRPPPRLPLSLKPLHPSPSHNPQLPHSILPHSRIQLPHKNILAIQTSQLNHYFPLHGQLQPIEPFLRLVTLTIDAGFDLARKRDVRDEQMWRRKVRRGFFNECGKEGLERVVRRREEPKG